ncbi:unnamed protein product [Trifolium pratense]|uniref:Uncharacterized protein n=1 Tax=Trifolium pratense TaxID=57577 RepID=A0ACB0LCX2_TRIPR|nr:unnamed protein product [Trifolium pratense]
MFCGSQGRPLNAATFLLDSLAKFTQDQTRRIGIGGFVTIIARALDLYTPLSQITLSVGVELMGIQFCFNNHLIGNLGPDTFQLLVNLEPVHEFTLPYYDKTSVHDKKNWLYNLEGQDETDPETPPYYHIINDPKPPTPLFIYSPAPPSPAQAAASTSVPPPDYGAAIADIQYELETLRADLATLKGDFHRFMDLVIGQFDRCSDQIRAIQLPPAAPQPSG